ncbi:uncharacterized protein [Lepeophtheirus salmonis]|uniref:uncharacterized protein n=1 Tax=Lepeophtheirus salmonis TaxID=72036 RepID=UPI001AE68D1A|nr:uncharacterized protein LOC121115655 [Lepeophtheirus salmonis]
MNILGIIFCCQVFVFIAVVGSDLVDDQEYEEAQSRGGKLLPLFNIVRFQNKPCGAGPLSGTCYTDKECNSRGGSNGGPCAGGYGICCTFTPECGSQSSENLTYLTNNNPSAGPCSYRICKNNDWVCRLRFDFIDFTMAQPVLTRAGEGSSIGDCTTDQFSVTSANGGSPVICGTNTGQHIIVDASQDCNVATFVVGPQPFSGRSWNVRVTQYSCNDESSPGGPPGCLQYFTEPTGVISSFNFPSNEKNANTFGTPTHLSNQMYTSCFRRNTNKCSICFTPTYTGGAIESFGVSESTIKNGPGSGSGSDCTGDYIVINGARQPDESHLSAIENSNRLCGSILHTLRKKKVSTTICTEDTPFRISFKTDDDENTLGKTQSTNEVKGTPSGTVGFSLSYFQRDC